MAKKQIVGKEVNKFVGSVRISPAPKKTKKGKK